METCILSNLTSTHLCIKNQYDCQHCKKILKLAKEIIEKHGIVIYVIET